MSEAVDTSTGEASGLRIYGALAAVMAEVGAIGKSQENTHDHYKFRGIDDVYNALHPALVRNGIVVVPTLLNQERSTFETATGKTHQLATVTVRYQFFASDGSCVDCVVPGEGADRSDKSFNKAMSSAYKNAMFQVFCIPTEGGSVDSESDTPDLSDARKAPPEPKRPTVADATLGAQDAQTHGDWSQADASADPGDQVDDPISEKQANRALVIASKRAKEMQEEHPSVIVNTVLRKAGYQPAPFGATREDVLEYLCRHITWRGKTYEDFCAALEEWTPPTEEPFAP